MTIVTAVRWRVWFLDLTDPRWDLAAATGLLVPAEVDRAVRASAAVCRRRLLVRAALRVLLGRVLRVPARRVPLAVENGRPYLTGAAGRRGIEVSCAAGGGLGVLAVARGTTVGIDVERHRDGDGSWGADAEDWLAPAEQDRLARLPAADRARALTRCWTQKEAVLKASGVGLRRPPSTVLTPVAPTGRSGEWSLGPVGVPAGFVASLAVRWPSAVPLRSATRLAPGALR